MYRRVILTFIIGLIFADLSAQNRGFGTVIGGIEENNSSLSFLGDNEVGVRVIVIVSAGGGGVNNQQMMAQGAGQVQILDVPTDTDYLELLLVYLRLDPRWLRKNKFRILRVAEAGDKPYLSKNIKREWTSYSFKPEYKSGGPFSTVQPGDIIIIERKGLFNRPFFDFLVDLRFLISLATFVTTTLIIYRTLK